MSNASSLDYKNVESSDTSLNGSQSHKAETLLSSVSCRASGLERVFGRRNALRAGAERDQILEECAKVSALCGTRKLLAPTRSEPALV